MTKKTIYGGLIFLSIFTLLVVAGIFLMQRYNGIANTENKLKEQVVLVDATVTDQKAQTKKLLEATKKLEDTTEYKNLAIENVSLGKTPDKFFKDDVSFQKNLLAYLDLISHDADLAKDESVAALLGQVQSDAGDLRDEKASYNSFVDIYNKKRNARPQFFSQLLGFIEYKKFTNISTPMDATPDSTTPSEPSQNQNNDINSFN